MGGGRRDCGTLVRRTAPTLNLPVRRTLYGTLRRRDSTTYVTTYVTTPELYDVRDNVRDNVVESRRR
jgi:hypothetical protein